MAAKRKRHQTKQELQASLARLQALHQIDKAITSTLELEELLAIVLREVRSIIRCDTISVHTLRAGRLEMVACDGAGCSDELGAVLALGPRPPRLRVIREGRAVAVADLAEAFPGRRERFQPPRSGQVRSWLGLPLMVEGSPIGVISLERTARDPFTDDELETVSAFATQAAIAIRNAQLYKSLRDSESNYRSIFEGVQDAIFVESLQGEILDVNRRACDMYGYTREEFLQRTVRDIVPAGKKIVFPEEVAAAGQWDQVFETENIRANGERFPVQMTARLQTLGDRQVLLAVVRDVSEVHQARRRAELQNRLASVGQLAAGIAHDFNNILGTILLYGELIKQEVADPSRVIGRVGTIIQQAGRGSSLIQQILDFSRRSIMEMHSIDMIPFLEELRAILSRTFRENVKILLELDQGTALKLNADPTRLQQALMNLALNAHEAMSEGGQLTVSVAKLEVEPGKPPLLDMESGPWIRLRVADTGAGIPAEVLPHIYEPFFTTREPGKGTGLGLAQVYGIVKQHNGYIDVESEVGRGTTFTLYFPALPESVDLSPAPETPPRFSGAGEVVLVVEDDLVLQQALADALESLNLTALSARNGVEAIRLFKQKRGKIRLVLSDLVMPEMGGRKLLEELRRLKSDVKVIFMTGYPVGMHTRELFDVNQVSWIQKPFTVLEISQAISKVLR
jgi:PAS domain S-box-containing protein